MRSEGGGATTVATAKPMNDWNVVPFGFSDYDCFIQTP